jgi:hypothetical protein
VINKVAVLFPTEVGKNATVKVWLLPAPIAAVAGNTRNWEAPVPVNLILEMDKVPPPALSTVNVFCEEVPIGVSSIDNAVTDTLICGVATAEVRTPLPRRLIRIGLPGALCVMERMAVLFPIEVGVKVTVTV